MIVEVLVTKAFQLKPPISFTLPQTTPASSNIYFNVRISSFKHTPIHHRTFAAMSSKRDKSQLISNTVAPPADAPSLDLEQLDKQFYDLDVHGSLKTMPTKMSTSKAFDSHKLSSFSSKRHQPSHQPSSQTQGGTVVKGSSKGHPLSSVVRHSERASSSRVHSHSPYPEDKKFRGPSSRQKTESGQSTTRQNTEHLSYPEDKKSRITSSSGRQSSTHTSSSSRHQPSQRTTQNTLPTATSRVKTEHYQVGNMERTSLEGMVPATQYAAHSSSSTHKIYPATTPNRTIDHSMAPPTTRTILVNPEDITMAARQTQYATLAPSERERQEVWAQSMIERTGSCPEGFAWKRIDDGYQCAGGHHVISDELLQEGMGGVYALEDETRPDDKLGPYYANPSDPKLFKYAGPMPKPDRAPSTVGGGLGLLSGGRASAARTSALASMQGGSRAVHGSGLHGSRFEGSHLRSRGEPLFGSGFPNSRPSPGSGHHGSGLHRPSGI